MTENEMRDLGFSDALIAAISEVTIGIATSVSAILEEEGGNAYVF